MGDPKVIFLAELQLNTFCGRRGVGMRRGREEGRRHEAHFPEEMAFMAFIAFTPFSHEVEQAPTRHVGLGKGWPRQINH